MIKKMITCAAALMLSSAAMADEWTSRKGMRFGYAYVNGAAEASEDVHSSHMTVLGLELQQTMKGGEWLDLLFIENVSITGLDQSFAAPSVSLMAGFEVNNQIQVGVGPNLAAFDPGEEENFFHLAGALGYTKAAGKFSVPLHVVYIPDVNGYWRFGATTGVNW